MAETKPEENVVIFEDEAGFSLHPKLGKVWAKKGLQPIVYTKSQRQCKINMFGWVELLGGHHGMMESETGDSEGFIKLLKIVLHKYEDKTIELWVDRAKWHKGIKIESFCASYSQLHIHYIPPYHPELNFQERIWRVTRYEETTNNYYTSFELMRYSIFKRSKSWKPRKIKSLCKIN